MSAETDKSDVDRLFDAAADLGQVAGLVNNAAITGPVVAGRGGAIVNVSSAAAIGWLLGSDASYTTGAVLRVAGGR